MPSQRVFTCVICGFDFPVVGKRTRICVECQRLHPPGRAPNRSTAVLVVALAAEVTRVRLINEEARARLAMGLWGRMCGRDDLITAAAEAHNLLAGSRPTGKPAIPQVPHVA